MDGTYPSRVRNAAEEWVSQQLSAWNFDVPESAHIDEIYDAPVNSRDAVDLALQLYPAVIDALGDRTDEIMSSLVISLGYSDHLSTEVPPGLDKLHCAELPSIYLTKRSNLSLLALREEYLVPLRAMGGINRTDVVAWYKCIRLEEALAYDWEYIRFIVWEQYPDKYQRYRRGLL